MSLPALSKLSSDPNQQREHVLKIRQQFFTDLLQEWSRSPEKIDQIMGQSDSFFMPDFIGRPNAPDTILINDAPRGILAASVTPSLDHLTDPPSLRWVYSILQAGDWLRFGFLIQGDPKMVLNYEQKHSHIQRIEQIWDRVCDYQFRDEGGLLLEWRFSEPNFYEDYAVRERFIIIARHLHFRLGKIMNSLLEADPIVAAPGKS